ncbi:MAG: GNAT family N-acetyltransferase [Chloroflexales bacterium]|nr:GNAT family N-acetyltransferase [Chloroflexales bacterium]
MHVRTMIRHGQRVAIRHPCADDMDELTALNQASRAFHHPWVAPPQTRDEYDAYMRRCERDDTACFLICRRADNRILGIVNLSQIFLGNFRSAYMGYYLGIQFAGQGYMTEAIGLVLDHAFSAIGLHRVEANIQPDNHTSKALLERLGFTREGYSRRYLRINDEWRDHERWAMITEDWTAIRAAGE